MANVQLNGIRVVPVGNSRFTSQNWSNKGAGYAFGGYIFNVDVSISFSKEPSTINIDIILDNLKNDSNDFKDPINQNKFDILQSDLKISNTNGEQLFDIFIENSEYKSYILWSYKEEISDKKILRVVFKDYSAILDKIYVGIYRRDSFESEINNQCNLVVNLPTQCLNCDFEEDSASIGNVQWQNTCYVGNYVNYGVGNKWPISIQYPPQNFKNYRTSLFASTQYGSLGDPGCFNLNGGYVIMGAEEFTDQYCGTVPEVKYSFGELIKVLENYGFNFQKAFDRFKNAFSTSDLNYRQNYNGTLRDVLGNWCADYALDFCFRDKSLLGIDLNAAVNIGEIVTITDINTPLGQKFSVGSSAVITSYNYETSLSNTYKQSVITQKVLPNQNINKTKTVKNRIGFLPMHSLSLAQENYNTSGAIDCYGRTIVRPKYTHDLTSSEKNTRHYRYTNRTFEEIDKSIALGKYSKELRDIYVGHRVLDNVDAGNSDGIKANFSALGFNGVREIVEADLKEDIVTFFLHKDTDINNDLNYTPAYYRTFIGFYDQQEHSDVTTWEGSCASSMYRYGYLVKGPKKSAPFIIPNYLETSTVNNTSTFPLYARSVTNDLSPGADQYFYDKKLPYIDSIAMTGVMPPSRNYDMFIAGIDNEWGTDSEIFQRAISFSDDISQACANAQGLDVDNQIHNNPVANDIKKQNFSFDMFVPKFFDNLEEYLDTDGFALSEMLATGLVGTDMDQVAKIVLNKDGKTRSQCQKVFICIIPDTRNHSYLYQNHPNAIFSFEYGNIVQNQTMRLNLVEKDREERRRLSLTIPKNYCDKSLEQDVSEALRSGLLSSTSDSEKYGCTFDSLREPTFIGFSSGYVLSGMNSRSLNVSITRNPLNPTPKWAKDYINIAGKMQKIPSEDTFQIAQAIDDGSLIPLETLTKTATIVYPIESFNIDENLYSGILTTNIEAKIGSVSKTEIYGAPPISNQDYTSVKIINNTIEPKLDPWYDPQNGFLNLTTYIDNNSISSITDIRSYHNAVENINLKEVLEKEEKVDVSVAGFLPEDFLNYCVPESGLVSLSYALGENGFTANASFANRPPTLPKQETIMNKVRALIK